LKDNNRGCKIKKSG